MLNAPHDWHYSAHFPCESYDEAWKMLATGEPMKVAMQMAMNAMENERAIGHVMVGPLALEFVHVEPTYHFGYYDHVTIQLEIRWKSQLYLKGENDA